MYGPDDPLPPLPESEPWDPTIPDPYLRRTPGERGYTQDDSYAVTSHLESAGVSCCLVGVAALQHFGAKRVDDCVDVCVPVTKLDSARRALLNHPDIYTPMKARNQFDPTARRHTLPWFKQSGVHVFFVLIPDSELSFTCVPANIAPSPKPPHLPFPKDVQWMQVLIELSKSHSGWKVDLDDMVDGLAATEQWGVEHLEEKYLEQFNKSVQGTKQRMLGKYPEEMYITRFRRRES